MRPSYKPVVRGNARRGAKPTESDADFISKCSIGLKEARESWMRLQVCKRCRIGSATDASALVLEGNELIAIVTTILKNKERTWR